MNFKIMKNSYIIKLIKMINLLGKSEVFCILLILYMIVLFFGTLCQKDMGLEFAQHYYFSSNFLFIMNKIPFPGGKLLLLFIFISLFIRILTDKWKKKKIGVFFIHLGVLFLILSAFVTSKYSEEGYLIINENSYTDFFIRNDQYELIIENKYDNKKYSIFLDKNNLITNIKINNSFNLTIKSLNINSDFFYKKKFFKKDFTDKLNRFFYVKNIPSFVEQQNNVPSIVMQFNNGNEFFVLGFNSISNYSCYEDKFFKIFLLKKKEKLPFSLYLIKFNKLIYPGTNIAKSYLSELLINNSNGLKWKQNIEMNKPFRFLGYTFYQASFMQNEIGNSTVLTVSKNAGSLIPYISIFIIFLGFIIHIIVSSKRFFRYRVES